MINILGQSQKDTIVIFRQRCHFLPMNFTPAQCRAGRALIGWSQDDLAKQAGVSKGTIAGFETERTAPIGLTIAAIRRALEIGGVRFTEKGVSLE